MILFVKFLFLAFICCTSSLTKAKDVNAKEERLSRHPHDKEAKIINTDSDDFPLFLVDVPSSSCTPPPSSMKKTRHHETIFPYHLTKNSHRGMILDEKHHIIVDWTPKAACTKVVEMVWNEMNITRGVFYPEKAFVHSYRPDFYVQCGTVSQEMLENPQYYKFKVVRNPFLRVVSSYIHVMKHHLLEIENDHGSKVLLVNDKHNSSFDVSDDDMSFEDFLAYYLETLLPNSHKINNFHRFSAMVHFEPQCTEDEINRFKNKNQKSIFNRIVHLENFDEDIALVNKDTNMNYSYPVGEDNHVVSKSKQPEIYLGNWSYSKLVKEKAIPINYGKFYNRKTRKMVIDIFFHDLKIYNYSFPFDRFY